MTGAFRASNSLDNRGKAAMRARRATMRGQSLMMAGALLAATALPTAAQTHLRIGLAEDPDILDPTLSRTYVGRIVYASICDKLFDITPDLKIVPQLATEYKWSDDNKALTLKLRPGVVFHDGEKLDAKAVKYSLERHLKFPGSNRKGEISAIESIDVVDEATVKLNLSAPFAPLIAQLTDRAGMIVSPKAAEALGDKFGTAPVCAGPYKFVERVAQDRIVVEKFAQYWDKANIHIDKITYVPIPDSTIRLANVKSGQLDIIERLQAVDVAAVKQDKNLKFAGIAGLGYTGITINIANGEQAKNPLGQDARVRQALELSIDRDAINQVVFNGEFLPGNQAVSPESPYYVKSVPVPKRDVAKAKQLLKEAGQPKPTFTMMVPQTTEVQRVGEVVQSMASEAGFDIKLQVTEFASALKFEEEGKFQAFLIGWSGRTDPDGNLYNFAHCKGPLNNAKYCNETVDKGLDLSRTASDPAERLKQYEVVAKQRAKDLPIVYLYHGTYLYALTPKLAGFAPVPDGLIRVTGLKLQ
jgi:peptide/nickel transport system substrate-binding protein